MPGPDLRELDAILNPSGYHRTLDLPNAVAQRQRLAWYDHRARDGLCPVCTRKGRKPIYYIDHETDQLIVYAHCPNCEHNQHL